MAQVKLISTKTGQCGTSVIINGTDGCAPITSGAAVAIGYDAVVGLRTVAIGSNAGKCSAEATCSAIFIGNQTKGGFNSVIIGNSAHGHSNSVTIGAAAASNCYENVAIGSGAGNLRARGTAVGYSSVTGDNATAIGKCADATGSYAVAIGTSSEARKTYSTSIGGGAVAAVLGSTIIGSNVKDYAIGLQHGMCNCTVVAIMEGSCEQKHGIIIVGDYIIFRINGTCKKIPKTKFFSVFE